MIKITRLIATILTLLLSFLFISCSSEKKENKDESQGAMLNIEDAKTSSTGENAAGISWEIPETWTKGEEKRMRLATYTTKGTDPAECAVFYFGAEQGGRADENVARWVNQIKQPDGSLSSEKAKESAFESTCCKIKLVEVNGSYLASSGPMLSVKKEKPNYTLIGAIVEAPEGNVFFKLTGPEKIVDYERKHFLTMLKEIE